MIHDERRLHRPFSYDRFGLRKWQGSSFTYFYCSHRVLDGQQS